MAFINKRGEIFNHVLYMKPAYSYVTCEPETKKERSASQIYNERNLLNNDSEGELSKKSSKKIREKIQWLVVSAKKKVVYDRNAKQSNKPLLSMIVLTYPSEQVHDDLYLKKQHLNQFLIECNHDYNMNNYIWKSESTFEGRIHFHIIQDKFIPHEEIRLKWNRIINKDGYVDRFQQNNTKAVDYDNPNSTDIHSIKNILNISAYFSEEMVKDKSVDYVSINVKSKGSKKEKLKQSIIQSKFHKYIYGISSQRSIDCILCHEKGVVTTNTQFFDDNGEITMISGREFIRELGLNEVYKCKDDEEIIQENNEIDYKEIRNCYSICGIAPKKRMLYKKSICRIGFKRRPIEGNIWGCGGNIAHITGIKMILEDSEMKLINRTINEYPHKVKRIERPDKCNPDEKFCIGELLLFNIFCFRDCGLISFNTVVTQFIEELHKPYIRKSKKPPPEEFPGHYFPVPEAA